MEELKARYQQQRARYEALVGQALTTNDPRVRAQLFPLIRDANLRLSATLDEMLRMLTNVGKETANIQMYRDELMTTLRRIQKDYNGLIQGTDQMETLRRIREYEDSKYTSSLHMYLIGILVMALALIVVLLFRGYKSPTTAMTTAMPPTTPALM